MKIKVLSGILAAAALAGCAAPYASQEFDFSQLEGGSVGVVERVLHPDGEERFVIRLDNGYRLKASASGVEQFEPGERVRVVQGIRGTRIARE